MRMDISRLAIQLQRTNEFVIYQPFSASRKRAQVKARRIDLTFVILARNSFGRIFPADCCAGGRARL
jgi:hypothetical protein